MDALYSPMSPSNFSNVDGGAKQADNNAAIDPNLENGPDTMKISPTTLKNIDAVMDEYVNPCFEMDPLEAAGELYNAQNNAVPTNQFEMPTLGNFNFDEAASSDTMIADHYGMLDPAQAHSAPQPWAHAPKATMNQSSYDLRDTSLPAMQYNNYTSYTVPTAYVNFKARMLSFSDDFREQSHSNEARGRRRPTTHRPAPMKLPAASFDRRRSLASIVSPKESPRDRHFSRERQLSDDFDASRARQQSLYKKERPKKDREHDWVRTNKTTQGLTSRTGKINAYDPVRDGEYKLTRHPIGTWAGAATGKEFEYTENGELRERVFTAEVINDFLFSHAMNAGSSLTLWIQKAPADCARRYPTRGSDKCLFAECPFKYEHRNILVGHMRVALDEQWIDHQDKRDPFFVAGYCHLYCLERFCDLPAIARDLRLRPDNRIFPREPRGIWAPSLGEGSLREIALGFIKHCKRGDLASKYPMYPFAATQQSPEGREPGSECIPFGSTLTCLLTDAKTKETNSSKRAAMASRGLGPSSILVHKGDLQLIMDAKVKTKRRKKSLVHKEVGKHVKRRMQVYEADQANADAQADAEFDSSEDGAPPPSRQGTKRKAAAESRKRTRELSDDDVMDVFSEEDYQPEAHPTKRRKDAAPPAVMYEPRPTPILASQTAPTPTTARLLPAVSRHGALMDSLYDFTPTYHEMPGPSKNRDAAAERKGELMGSMFGF